MCTIKWPSIGKANSKDYRRERQKQTLSSLSHHRNNVLIGSEEKNTKQAIKPVIELKAPFFQCYSFIYRKTWSLTYTFNFSFFYAYWKPNTPSSHHFYFIANIYLNMIKLFLYFPYSIIIFHLFVCVFLTYFIFLKCLYWLWYYICILHLFEFLHPYPTVWFFSNNLCIFQTPPIQL